VLMDFRHDLSLEISITLIKGIVASTLS
jgi:hypothetical protein